MEKTLNRRDFVQAIAAISLVPALLPGRATAAQVDYTPGLVAERLAAGETLFVTFSASWCSTCAAQERVMDAIKATNPAYESAVTFVNVDWDLYQDDALTTSLDVPRRSTLVVLKGDAELGRVVAGTSEAEIKGLMDIALSAATAS
jgi:thioredoxin 1